MNILPEKTKQIEIIGMLCEGVGQRAVSRLTGTDRKTVARLALAIGRGCAELHDRMMVGLRVHRIECDELWAYVGHKRNPQKGPKRHPSPVMGDQYTYVALASSTRAIIGYLTGKRDSENTEQFIHDLRERVIGAPEISTDGLSSYKNCDPRCVWHQASRMASSIRPIQRNAPCGNGSSRRYSPGTSSSSRARRSKAASRGKSRPATWNGKI